MLVKIVPIKRLPKHLSKFDYLVPDELQSKIKVGQLVQIPFRKSTMFGLVFKVDKKSKEDAKLKQIEGIVNEEPFLSEKQIDILQTLSEWYAVSLSTLVKMSLLPMQKRKLIKIKLNRIKNQESRISDVKINYTHYTSKEKHKELLVKKVKQQTLILVPEVHLADEIHKLLPVALQKKTVVWHSSLSVKQQFERWLEIRNKKKTIIIGTRGAVFLPLPNLKNIIIDYEHEENHKHWDQAPRFHVKDVAELLAKTCGAKLHLMSYSPSCESYYYVHKGNYIVIPSGSVSGRRSRGIPLSSSTKLRDPSASFGAFGMTSTDLPIIIDMKQERLAKNFSIFSDKVEGILSRAKEDVFLFINRKGYATSVGCNDCGNIETCQNCKTPLVYHEKTNTLHCHYCNIKKPMPLTCGRCKSTVVRMRGVGTELVEAEARKLLGPNSQFKVIRIDSEMDEQILYSKKPRIIIGTEMAFRYLDWNKTKTIVFINPDNQLAIPEYLAGEHVWHLIQKVQFRKKPKAKFFIQTFQPNHFIFRSLKEPDRFYRTDLNSRQKLLYPPYIYLVRYFYGNADKFASKKEAERVYRDLTKRLKSAKIMKLRGRQSLLFVIHPIEMHPHYYRRQFWYTILVKLPVKNWEKELVELNKLIPGRWKVDPNPISILSP